MKALGVFDKTVQKTGHWVEALARETGSPDYERSYRILCAVLHALRDRLPRDEAIQFAAQLPTLLRGMYFEGWTPRRTPRRYRHKAPFLEQIGHAIPTLDPVQRERAVASVFAVLDKEMPSGELDQVFHALPRELRDLWPRRASAA